MADPIDQLIKSIKDSLENVESTRNMKKLADEMALQIKKRTREGFGTPKGSRGRGIKERLKPLSQSTIDSRKRLRGKGQLSGKTSPSKSNLTETGQLLDSLRGRVPRKGEAEVSLRSGRRSKGKGKRITNDEVAFFVSGDRPFLDLSRSDFNKIVKKLEGQVSSDILKGLTKIR